MYKVYKAKQVITMEEQEQIFRYLITRGEEIVYTGNTIPEAYRGCSFKDLGEQVIVPGFFDTHAHFSSYGFFIQSMSIFQGKKTISELLKEMEAYIKRHAKSFYIFFGVSPSALSEQRLPIKDELNTIKTKKPIFIVQYDGHAGIANSACMKKLKLKKKDEKRVDGLNFEKGHFFQDAFYMAVKKVTQKAPLIDALKGVKHGADYAAKQGITSMVALQGEGFPLDFDLKLVKLYAKFSKIQIIPYFQTRSIKKIEQSKLKTWGGCFECALDGSFGSLDAAMKEPYSIETGIKGNRGKLFYHHQLLIPMLQYANQKGIQLAIHAIGDEATEQVMDVFSEYVDSENPHTHRIEHALLLSKEEIKRIAKHRIHIATQPAFLGGGVEPVELLKNLLGEERFKRFMPLKEMVEAGIIVSGGSDAPVTLPNPIMGMHHAMNHPNPEQSLNAYQALELFTINGARGVRKEKKQGSLSFGKLADFVVLSESPLDVDVEKIKDIEVKQVFKNGKRIV